MCQFVNVSMRQCVNVSMRQCVNVSMCQCVNASMCQCVNVSMCRFVNVSNYGLFNHSFEQGWTFLKYRNGSAYLPQQVHEYIETNYPRTYVTLEYPGVYMFGMSETIAVVMMTVNRLTCVVIPMKHEQVSK